MPVGTAGAMKGIHWRDIREAGADIVLGNTYHLMLRPGAERIAALGGLQKFTTWNGPMLTDSGGFQVMSLAKLRKLTEHAVTFSSHIDGAKVELSPRNAPSRYSACWAPTSPCNSMNACGCPADHAEIERAMQLSIPLGRTQQARVRYGARRLHAVRHRAGRRYSRPAPRERPRPDRQSVSTFTPLAGLLSASRRL